MAMTDKRCSGTSAYYHQERKNLRVKKRAENGGGVFETKSQKRRYKKAKRNTGGVERREMDEMMVGRRREEEKKREGKGRDGRIYVCLSVLPCPHLELHNSNPFSPAARPYEEHELLLSVSMSF